jgi:hypothetical protein
LGGAAIGVVAMLEVTRAQYQEGYKIWVEFNDGVSGVVDLSETLWGPIFEPLRDIERFKRFAVSDVLHTIVWENDADLAPEYLYEKLAGQRSQLAASKHTC